MKVFARRTVSLRARRPPRQLGSALLAVLIAISVIAVAGMGAAQMTVLGALQARRAREREQGRQASAALLDASMPTALGGAVHPDAPVDGFWDTVAVDPATGDLVTVTSRPPAGAVVFRRQWLVESDAAGYRVVSVSCVALEGDLATPRSGAREVVIRMSRIEE
jgi:Tfp pilus assembly protein PilX